MFVKTACLYQNAPVKTAWLCKHIAAEISSLSPPSMFDGQADVFMITERIAFLSDLLVNPDG